MPPNKPLSTRRRNSTAPSGRTIQKATPRLVGFWGFGFRAGRVSAISRVNTPHTARPSVWTVSMIFVASSRFRLKNTSSTSTTKSMGV